VLRTMRTNFYASRDTTSKLFELNKTSALVWNECLKLSKDHYLNTGKWSKQNQVTRTYKETVRNA